jgi:fused signal recognition particle receptor
MSPTVILLLLVGLSVLVCLSALYLLCRRDEGLPPPEKREETAEPALFLRRASLAMAVKTLFSGHAKTIADAVPVLEETLLAADAGIPATQGLVEKLLAQTDIRDADAASRFIADEIRNLLTPQSALTLERGHTPVVIYLVGVNGVGKTTTIGKLASQFRADGKSVLLVAADTFRAAAVDQLRVWADRNGTDFVGGATQADPASVIIDGLRSARSKKSDVVLIDTAGRLHTKTNLMNELQKMVRMCAKELQRGPDEIWLVVDAVTGQNGFAQAEVFCQAVPLTGVILTKYDSTARGGIIIAIAQKTGLPIRYVGLGEKITDLKKFDPKEFVERIF